MPILHATPVLPPKHFNTSVYLDLNNFSRHTAWAHGFMHDYALWLGPVLLALVFVGAYAVAWWRRASEGQSGLSPRPGIRPRRPPAAGGPEPRARSVQ